jgi:hypothetical protein
VSELIILLLKKDQMDRSDYILYELELMTQLLKSSKLRIVT